MALHNFSLFRSNRHAELISSSNLGIPGYALGYITLGLADTHTSYLALSMHNTSGKYEEHLPCGGTLSITVTDWSIRYYFPGPTARHNGTFFNIPGRSVAEYITVLRENWEQLEALKAAVPTGGEFSKGGKLSTSIRIGSFAAGVCLHYHYLPMNTKKRLDEVVAGYEYATERAPRVQAMLQAL